jgi:hypothetical protein
MATSNIGDTLVNWVDIDEMVFERPFFYYLERTSSMGLGQFRPYILVGKSYFMI